MPAVDKKEKTPEQLDLKEQKAADKAKKRLLEMQKLTLEVSTAEQELQQAEFMTEATRITVDDALRKEEEVLAANRHHHIYNFNFPIEDESVRYCINHLTMWQRTEPGCDVKILLNSLGGDMVAGFHLIDAIRDLRGEGHEVTIKAIGMAASMGAVVLQSGDIRSMGKYATLMLHEGSLAYAGSYGEVQDHIVFMEGMHKRALDLLSERAKIPRTKIKENWKRRDWFIDSTEALKLGLIDVIE